ncbi:MAG: hypothetical protein EAZ89_00725 [Bacteroidetes bacterium]|nr:MAG: hypothetical protein EAZ89_00725 [Bacteroidota bacterium]
MKQIATLLLLGFGLHPVFAQPDIYDEKVTSAGNIAATVSNLGIYGNSFSGSFNVLGYPSCEYPVNSGIEHVFEGGLWVGGRVNGQIAVSTAAVDDASGYSTGKSGFEFTSKQALSEKSSLFDNPYYDPSAISQQDFSSVFTDTSLFVTTQSSRIPIIEHLNPLGLKVEFRSLNWNFPFANFFVILSFRISNIGPTPIDSVFVGYWIDGVIRNINITPPGGTAFYNKGGNGFVDSLNMAYEFDATGDPGYTDSYVGTKFLGAEYVGQTALSPDFKVNFNTWQFRNSADPLYFYPSSDLQKYGKLSSGLNYLAGWNDIQTSISTPNNRSNLISAGPFTRINPGESIDVAFAIVCARRVFDGLPASANTAAQRANLNQNAGWAQTAYDGEDANGNLILDPGEDRDGNGRITRFILPSPPDLPKMKVVPGDHEITVYWSENSELSVDPISKQRDFEGYRLYKTAVGFDVQNTQNIVSALKLVGEWDLPGNEKSFDTGFESIRLAQAVTFPGDTTRYHYKYTFTNIANGWQHVVALAAYDGGDEVNNLEPLESAPLANLRRVFAGKPANNSFSNGDPFVYPNPYYARAGWEGSSRFEEDRKLIFANLPARCEVRIYTVAGDLIDAFEHDQYYNGSDIRWFNTYSESGRNETRSSDPAILKEYGRSSEPGKVSFSGGEHAWDLLSADTQIIARGLYLFVVTDLDTGEKKRGKFVIIK